MFKVVKRVADSTPKCDKYQLMDKMRENKFSVLASVYDGEVSVYINDITSHEFRQFSKGSLGINSRSNNFTEMMAKNNWGDGPNDIFLFSSLKELVDTAEEKGWVL